MKYIKRLKGISLFATLILQLLVYGNSYNVVADLEGIGVEDPSNDIETQVKNQLHKIAIPFIENQGQLDSQVQYYANTFFGTVFVTNDSLTYSLHKDENYTLAIKERFLDSSQLEPVGLQKSPTVVSYFVGEKENWESNIPTYDGIGLGRLWDGIDVSLKAYGYNIEKIFTVNPSGNPADIRIEIDGTNGLSINNEGQLLVETSLGTVSMSKPIAYQDINGVRKNVKISYITDGDVHGFDVGEYDTDYILIIDPLIASTFIGGSGSDEAKAFVLSGSDVYIAGTTTSTTYPTTTGVSDTTHNGSNDAFVSKLDSSLTTLVASTFVGGSGFDVANAIAIDGSGNVFITGSTTSSNFPTTGGAFDTSFGGGGFNDAFVSKLDSSLTTLMASTFIGGSVSADPANAIAIDGSGNVFISGRTFSSDYPTTTGVSDTTHNGGEDVFVSKLDSSLTTLIASTFIGGSSSDAANAIAIDGSGNVFISGRTASSNFPTTSGVLDATLSGQEAFVSKLNPSLTTLIASTFIGGSGSDEAKAFVLSGSDVYIAGTTASTDYPTTTGAFDTTHNGSDDVFVSKLDSSLTTLVASTFLGAIGTDSGNAIAIDSSGNVYVTGNAASSSFPTTGGAFDNTNGGFAEIFISKFNSSLSTLIYSTFLGGNNNDVANGIVADSSGNVFIVGRTATTTYPTTTGAFDTTHNGSDDVIITHLDLSPVITLSEQVTLSDQLGYSTIPITFIQDITVGDSPNDVAVNEVTNRIYVTNRVSGTVSVIDGTNNSIITTISGLGSPNSVAVNEVTNRIYVTEADEGGGTLKVIDGTNNSIITTISGLGSPNSVAVNEVTNRIYVVDSIGDLIIINGVDNSIISTLSNISCCPRDVAVNEVTNRIYVPDAEDVQTKVLNGIDNSIITTISGSADGVAVNEVTNRFYITSSNVFKVFDGTNNSPITSISVSSASFRDLVVNECLNTIYLTSFGDKTFVIDGTDNSIIARLIGFSNPNGLDVNEVSGRLYITNFLADTVSVFEIEGCAPISVSLSETIGISDSITATTPTQVTTTQAVGDGGTATVQLPSGTDARIKLRAGQFGTVRMSTTTALTTGPAGTTLVFADQVVDITAPAGCAAGCDITFVITQTLLNAIPLTVADVRIFHDANDDDDFADAGETFVPTVTDLGGGLFRFTANIPFSSKFAVGGIGALFLGGLSGEFAPPTFSSKAFAENEYPLTIDGTGYKLEQYSNTIPTISLETGKPIQIKTLLYDPGGVSSIQHLAMYMNLRGLQRDIQYSDTYIIYDKSSPTVISDPNGFFGSVNVTPTQVGNKLELTFDITFAKPMEKSDIIFRMWDDRRNNVDTKVFDAILVTGPEMESTQPTESAQPTQTTESTLNIPSWIKNNAGWWKDGQIGDSDFVSGIQYLINEGIMTIPETEAGQTTTQNIPAWVKNNAGWWRDGLISDSDFVTGIQWLISNGIMRIG